MANVVRLRGPMAAPIALAGALLDRNALAVADYATDEDTARAAVGLLKKQSRRDAERWAEREYRRLRKRGRVKSALILVLQATRTAEEAEATIYV